MAANSSIEWTGRTWNPVTGCTAISPGCLNCYAAGMSARLGGMAAKDLAAGRNPGRKVNYVDLTVRRAGRVMFNGTTRCVPEALMDPFRWREPQLVFVNSMSDLFHTDIPDDFIDEVHAVMILNPRHTFQVLTKRDHRLAGYTTYPERRQKIWLRLNDRLPKCDVSQIEGMRPNWPAKNIWHGVSIENQKFIGRLNRLRNAVSAVKFLSCEPLLGPLNFGATAGLCGIDWVITGGESGAKARPKEDDWFRGIRDQCLAEGVPFFFKQHGGRDKKAAGRELDGRTWDQMPKGHGCSSSNEARASRSSSATRRTRSRSSTSLGPSATAHASA